ncbi:uncharacterized protein M421DRAFT_104303 [Didymella exigua CBS 183.55]|uniref:Uncharacterized protein n=1 Tax=Didymella exigua CBS 183.55 TaxID=1150837 RepID=A0A6A5R8P9_9PLEO|nr:uncharacterized protein M421DRAFT_104303 [Didymella exigua CBS 183.55]KAF1923709.1 hypothetical protein M421DRAFT_104303 [Didymella exigua CBS 183.55]
MPATPTLFSALLQRSAGSADNATGQTLDVVCAWPVSSQYGAGSRFLYYVLVATCVFLRKHEWLRNACIAAALVVPSISALHGIVLTSFHVNGAVDLDIYGAWQICSIAIIAVPFTLRKSRTYFYDAGRNIIFLWTMLLVAGLIALCVEFSRVTATDCSHQEAEVPYLTRAGFPYGETTCGLVCSEDDGPFSPMRGGAAKNIYVIPVPSRVSFNAAMLIAAGVCIPAIISLIFTWDKILAINWKKRSDPARPDEQIEGVNITPREIKGINDKVRLFLTVIEIPLFGGAVIAILIAGELNFFSKQLIYQTEPMASIGQWSPIAGTLMAALGSLYIVWATDGEIIVYDKPKAPRSVSSQSNHSERPQTRGRSSTQQYSPTRTTPGTETFPRLSSDLDALQISITGASRAPSPDEHIETVRTRTDTAKSDFNAGRGKVRNWFEKASVYMSDAAHRSLDVADYDNPKARRYPWIPGEELKNKHIHRTSTSYAEKRRAASEYALSIASAREPSPSPPPDTSPRLESDTDAITIVAPRRRSTLEVPPLVSIHSTVPRHVRLPVDVTGAGSAFLGLCVMGWSGSTRGVWGRRCARGRGEWVCG